MDLRSWVEGVVGGARPVAQPYGPPVLVRGRGRRSVVQDPLLSPMGVRSWRGGVVGGAGPVAQPQGPTGGRGRGPSLRAIDLRSWLGGVVGSKYKTSQTLLLSGECKFPCPPIRASKTPACPSARGVFLHVFFCFVRGRRCLKFQARHRLGNSFRRRQVDGRPTLHKGGP